jgi:hypothetical protein
MRSLVPVTLWWQMTSLRVVNLWCHGTPFNWTDTTQPCDHTSRVHAFWFPSRVSFHRLSVSHFLTTGLIVRHSRMVIRLLGELDTLRRPSVVCLQWNHHHKAIHMGIMPIDLRLRMLVKNASPPLIAFHKHPNSSLESQAPGAWGLEPAEARYGDLGTVPVHGRPPSFLFCDDDAGQEWLTRSSCRG